MTTMPRLTAAERREAGLEAASVEIPKVVFSKTQTGPRPEPESPAATSARRSRVSNANPEKRKAA
jgi:hypothetical protein